MAREGDYVFIYLKTVIFPKYSEYFQSNFEYNVHNTLNGILSTFDQQSLWNRVFSAKLNVCRKIIVNVFAII